MLIKAPPDKVNKKIVIKNLRNFINMTLATVIIIKLNIFSPF